MCVPKRENEEIEFKKTISELKEGIISLSSMLNKNNHGVVYFGIKNDGSIYGQQLGANTTSNIVNEIKYHIKPFINPKISSVEVDSKTIVMVEAIGNDTPYSAYGRYYKRCDDQDLEMTQAELEYDFQNKNITYSNWERKLTPYGEEAVDEEMLIEYINQANELNRMNYRYESIEDAMTRLGLMENGKLNNAGYYLFSNKKPLMIKLARYATDEKLTFIDNRHFFGNIIECIEESYKYILSSINFNAVVDGFKRVEKPEIPLEAIREIVVNSFAHMRVSEGEYNEITISPSMVKIYNPGTIALNKDPIEFASGEVGSKVRNPLIALTLYKNRTIEAFGTGFRRVFEICNGNNIKYSYTNEELGFSFVFQRRSPLFSNITDKKHILKEDSDFELNSTDKEVFDYIKKHRKARTVSEIAVTINKSEVTVQRSLLKLVSKQLINRVGSRKTGYWSI